MNYRLSHGMYIINKHKLNDRDYNKMMVYNKKYKNTNICCVGINIINKYKNNTNVYMFLDPPFLLTSSFFFKTKTLV